MRWTPVSRSDTSARATTTEPARVAPPRELDGFREGVGGSVTETSVQLERLSDPVTSGTLLDQVPLDRLLHDSGEALLPSLSGEFEEAGPVLIAEFDGGSHGSRFLTCTCMSCVRLP